MSLLVGVCFCHVVLCLFCLGSCLTPHLLFLFPSIFPSQFPRHYSIPGKRSSYRHYHAGRPYLSPQSAKVAGLFLLLLARCCVVGSACR
ncbi:hypothetical protein BO85DRAFT_451269 [Aspergillus piperis CBS 112811]|uniref:Secreted protein n=1 Tax=Aspergillus piperis CBS 112811 TaxID=1448313 RepID=A0A8G1R241_9EURO|nr:hypothetical protein BO85DRAFT_451269 [Aspergillus piperis CBS 112811]RAH55480.1 hypothetical protein BO85DRAFT_451269 [Aspergillus piperis CBS 112811]